MKAYDASYSKIIREHKDKDKDNNKDDNNDKDTSIPSMMIPPYGCPGHPGHSGHLGHPGQSGNPGHTGHPVSLTGPSVSPFWDFFDRKLPSSHMWQLSNKSDDRSLQALYPREEEGEEAEHCQQKLPENVWKMNCLSNSPTTNQLSEVRSYQGEDISERYLLPREYLNL